MSKLKGEPSLEKIDDFKGKESKSKRRTIYLIIILLLLLSASLAYFKLDTYSKADYLYVDEQKNEQKDK